MSGHRQEILGVFGTWRAPEASAIYSEARELGRLAAKDGLAVLSGGYSGVMEASARGAREAGGRTIGILCAHLDAELAPNSYLDEREYAPSLASRAARCVERSDWLAFFPGRTGTAAELVLALDVRSKIGPDGRILLVGSFWQPLLETLARVQDHLPLERAATGAAVWQPVSDAQHAARVIRAGSAR